MKYTLPRNHKMFLLLMALWLIFWLTGLVRLPATLSQNRLLTVVSGSMEPALPTGTLIAVQKPGDKLFAPDEIITFQQDDILITHRIVEVGYDHGFYYITQGDANANPDVQPVRPRDVMGHVVFIMPAVLVPVLSLLRTPSAVIFLLLLLRLLWALSKQPAPSRIGTARRETKHV